MNQLVPRVEEHPCSHGRQTLGYRLVQCETDTGQLIWEWRHGHEPRPQFVARRVAIDWMTELLARDRTVAFVSTVGVSCAATSLRRGDVMPTYRMADGEGRSGGRLARAARLQDARIFMTDVNITPARLVRTSSRARYD